MAEITTARSGNVLVPYVDAKKRTKEIPITLGTVTTDGGTPATPVTHFAEGIFYSDSNGKWRFKFNIRVAFTGITFNYMYLPIVGVAFAVKSGYGYQSISCFLDGSADKNVNGIAVHGTNELQATCFMVTASAVTFSGDIELESEPTTYTTAANMEDVAAVDMFIAENSLPGSKLLDNSIPVSKLVSKGSGNGEKNYMTNPSGENNTSDWSASNAAILSITRDVTASELPREYTTKTGLKIMAVTGDQTGVYVSTPFSLDDVDLNKKLKIQFSMKQLGAYVANDLSVYIAAAASPQTVLYAPLTTNIAAADGVFQTSFDSQNVAALCLVFKATTNMADNAGIVVSDIVVGPGTIYLMDSAEFAFNTSGSNINTDIVSFGTGPGGKAFNALTNAVVRRVQFSTPIRQTDNITIEISNGGPWVSIIGAEGAYGVSGYVTQATTSYGIGLVTNASGGGSLGPNEVDVMFGTYSYPSAATYGAAGNAWSTVGAVSWRVRKSSSGLVNVGEIQNAARRTKTVTLGFDSTPAGWSLDKAIGMAFSDSLDNWYLWFKIKASANANTTLAAVLTGVTFPAQLTPLTVFSTSIPELYRAYANESNGQVVINYANANGSFAVTGTVPLASKPAWADANMETNTWQPVGFGLATDNSYGLLKYYKKVIKNSPISGVDSGIATMEIVQTRINNVVTLHIKAPNVTLYKQGLGKIVFPIDPEFTPTNHSYHVGMVTHSALDTLANQVMVSAVGAVILNSNVAGSDFSNDAVNPVTFQYQSFTYNVD